LGSKMVGFIIPFIQILRQDYCTARLQYLGAGKVAIEGLQLFRLDEDEVVQQSLVSLTSDSFSAGTASTFLSSSSSMVSRAQLDVEQDIRDEISEGLHTPAMSVLYCFSTNIVVLNPVDSILHTGTVQYSAVTADTE
ncbi:hypothetical protein Hamer_G019430, partial [Homarus americanus]